MTTLLVANKTDLENKYTNLIFRRVISYDEGFNCAKKNGMSFMECSAKTAQNIEPVFVHISEAIVGKIDKGEIDPKN